MDQPARIRRPRNRIDLTGLVFGELTARIRVPKEVGCQGEKWLCDCKCGRKTIVRVKDLSHHNTRSCGHLTGRPRPEPGEPHRAPAGAYPEIEREVHAALRSGTKLHKKLLRERFQDRLSHGTFYRFIAKAEAAWRAEAAALAAAAAAAATAP